MSIVYSIGILGCGDYLRWEHKSIRDSYYVVVKSLYDPVPERADRYARFFDARVAASEEAVLADPEISIVLIFTPPSVRKDLLTRAAEEGKNIITVKPLAPTLQEATEMVEAVAGRVDCSVLYNRSANPRIETLKHIFESGEIGRLALYRQDWIHHYPTWNTWAIDPEKNGGPFMDAMIHNLNTARYLASSEPVSVAFFSDSHALELPCADTELMKLNFEDGAAADLFITWAADLEIYDPTKNDREHIDIWYMATDQHWYVTVEGGEVRAKKEDQVRTWPIEEKGFNPYDQFIHNQLECLPIPWDIVDAWKDIAIMERAASNPGRTVPLDLTPPA